MPDITMCSNNECPLKENCYRFKAIPSDWQSYSSFNPVKDNKYQYTCDHFMKIHEKQIKKI
jgi:hypothetical protein